MTLNHHSITRDKDKEILREKMASCLFIQINNPYLNIIQDNEVIKTVIPPPPSLVLANRIRRIIPMKFKPIVQLMKDH